MSEQPKLRGKHESWAHIARELGDCDLEDVGTGYSSHRVLEPVTDAYFVGDWVPSEAACTEILQLREQLAKVTEERDRLRKAGNTLADAAKKRLSEWTRETYMAVQETETAWREAVGGGEDQA